MSRPSFSSLKKYAKIKKSPTLAKESALISLVKNQRPEYNHHTIYMEQYIKPPLYYIKSIEVRKHHTMDPIMEGILSCSLASLRWLPPIELPLQIQ
jgi:hypothetical protein